MKKFNPVLLCLLVPLLFSGCTKKDATPADPSGAKMKVGLVFDVGGRGDKSFNDSAYEGLEKAKRELGVDYEYIEPGEGSDREGALKKLASRGYPLVIAVGFIFSDDVLNTAKDFPKRLFACVDYAIKDNTPLPPNLAALKFKEEDGSFLVGALAGLLTKTGRIGFVGGMKIPLVKKFEAGFNAGVKRVNPSAQIFVAYAGVTSDAFKNPGKGKELALSQYDHGVDIIFHVSGSTGLGVFEAAREAGRLAIGVDSDQYKEAPGYVLTSMRKRVDIAVFQIIKDVLEGNFEGGVKEFGLESDGVGFVYDDNNKAIIPGDVYKKVETLKEEIIAGRIKVPRTVE